MEIERDPEVKNVLYFYKITEKYYDILINLYVYVVSFTINVF